MFIATAERLHRDHRSDASFDFSPVLTRLAKAVEVQGNALLRRAAAKPPTSARLANIEGRTVDLTRYRALTLGQLARVVSGERGLSEGLGKVLEAAAQWRNRLVGIGCEGDLVALARTRVRSPAGDCQRVAV